MLTALWLLPAVGGAVTAFLPRRFGKWLAVAVAVATLALTLAMALAFDTGQHGYQFEQRLDWIPQYGSSYHLGVDGISLWLLVLNALLGVIAVVATPLEVTDEPRFCGLLLLMQAGMAGVFMAVDLVLFYVFWEAMLIPAYFLLWLWGVGTRPVYAALKFVLFTLVGSLLMLVGILGEYVATGSRSFDLPVLLARPPGPAGQFGLFFLFVAAFLVKVPVFPLHGWLRDAYLGAPTPMLLLLAGVMGKTGIYGLLRVVLPLFPQPVSAWNWNAVIPVLAVASIVWGALMALTQRDVKALIAYSSLSHMGFIVLGVFAFNAQGQQGAVLQMVNHGLIVPALFLIVAWLEQRTGSRDRGALLGLAPRMPVLAGVFLVVTLAALGMPGLNSFAGEFMTLLGAWRFSPALAVVGSTGMILAPIYMLRLFQGAMHGREAEHFLGRHGHGEHQPEPERRRSDLRAGELALVAPLVVLMFVLGLYPDLLVRAMYAVGQPMPWS
jgi:NADH-quinone oxidoreductase subunit M